MPRSAFLLPLLFLLVLAPVARGQDERPLPLVEGAAAAGPEPFVFAQGFGRGQEVPFVRDLDADGYAEPIVFVRDGKGQVYAVRNELGQKAHASRRIFSGPGAGGRPVAVVDLFGSGRPLLAGLDKKGALVTGQRKQADGSYRSIRLGAAPAGTATLVAGDFDGDGLEDLVAIASEGGARGVAHLLSWPGQGDVASRRLADDVPVGALAADTRGAGRKDLLWLEGARLIALRTDGKVRRVLLTNGVRGPLLAAGDVDGDGRDDLAVPGAWLLIGPHAVRRVPDARLDGLPGEGKVAIGDIDGDGLGDLCWFTYRGRRDVVVTLSRPPAFYRGALPGMRDTDHDGLRDLEELWLKTDPLRRDTDRDGLLDGWEVHGFRGVRLDRLGADPRRRDIFLELDVQEGASAKRVQRAIRRMETLYARAPIQNPDGSTGISIHLDTDTRTPKFKKGPSRQALREMFFTPERAGMFHWMHLAAKGGGGQANLLSDHGACAGAYEATLPHEFGHQLGLKHGGRTAKNGVPVYPSLMNYAYNYQLGGDANAIDYSRGHLAQLSLDENDLSERVGVAPEHLAFLGKRPFYFRVEPREPEAPVAPDPGSAAGSERASDQTAPPVRASWVDWNRNGVEDERRVRANINAASGQGYGQRVILDKSLKREKAPSKSLRAPLLLTVGAEEGGPGRLALVHVGQATDRLQLSVLASDDWKKLSAPREVSTIQGLDHLTGYADGEVVHIFALWQGAEVLELTGTLDAPQWQAAGIVARGEGGAAFTEPAVALRKVVGGCAVEGGALVYGEPVFTAYLALRDPATGRVRVSMRARRGDSFSPGVETDELTSETPVALAHDTVRDEVLVAFTQTQTRGKKKSKYRLRLARLDPETLAVRSVEWVGGAKGSDATSRRPALLFEAAPWLPAEGRVDIFHAGVVDAKKPNLHMFRSYTIGDRAWRGRGGWKEDMTWNEWSYSKDAPSAAWFRGRPMQVTRFFTHYKSGRRWNDHLALGPNADGICDAGLTDCNDWEIIESYGLERSILQTRTPTGKR